VSNDDLAFLGKVLLWVLPPALVVILVRGALAAIIRKIIFYAIDDKKDGHPILKSIIDEIYTERCEEIDSTINQADNNDGRLKAVEQAIIVHSTEISELDNAMGDMPRWIDAVERLDGTLGKLGEEFSEFRKELGKVSQDVAVMKDRWDGQERRRNPRT